MFPSNAPDSSFEYPELVVCPINPAVSMNVGQCILNSTLGSSVCLRDGFVAEGTYNGQPTNRTCIKIKGGKVNSVQDRMMLNLNMVNVPQNSPSGVILSTVGGAFDSFGSLQVLSAQAWSYNEILIR